LPIGIRDEAHRGIERRVGADRGKVLRIQGQERLQAQQPVHQEAAEDIEDEQRDGVFAPRHLALRLDAAEAVNERLEAPAQTPGEVRPALHDIRDVAAERLRADEEDPEEQHEEHEEARLGGHQNRSALSSANSR
jgi:hypothetical protein